MLTCADEATVPAGGALAVDREVFARVVTRRIESHPLITVVREECTLLPDGPTIIASGPLTSDALAEQISALGGSKYLYFYDAIAPIVSHDSIDFTLAFRASRYGHHADGVVTEPGENLGEGDYINCPMNKAEYFAFVDALLTAEGATLRDFELRTEEFFEGCLPVEVMARRGRESLAFGPMRPVGLRDPRTNKRPFAVVQLRQDNIAGTLFNIVGFQTNLKYQEQDRVLRMIPGLGSAEFVRYGQMHRNTFINSPTLLAASMQYAPRDTDQSVPHPSLFFAGQIVGVEGYVGNAATGLLAGINMARYMRGQPTLTLPPTTMLGALCHYVTHAEPDHFQPMKAAFGIFPKLDNPPKDKRRRAELYSERAQADFAAFIAAERIEPILMHPANPV
jgi:methylenetetrahydrofolate--tRNA-(uracil-5-)-methyltransferase